MADWITVKGSLHGKDRPRFNRDTGAVYTPKQTREYEELVAWCYKMQGGRHWLDQPVEVEIIAYFGAPKVSKKRRLLMLLGKLFPLIKPDADNIAKIILDALNGVAYNDDKQVTDLIVRKRYAEEPRLLVMVDRHMVKGRKHEATEFI